MLLLDKVILIAIKVGIIGLLIFLFFYAFVDAVYEDSFNSYELGNLVPQQHWYLATTSVPYAIPTAKIVEFSNANMLSSDLSQSSGSWTGGEKRFFNNSDNGSIQSYVYMDVTGSPADIGGLDIEIMDSEGEVIAVGGYANKAWRYRTSDGYSYFHTDFPENAWKKVRLEWRYTGGSRQIRYTLGSNQTDWISPISASSTSAYYIQVWITHNGSGENIGIPYVNYLRVDGDNYIPYQKEEYIAPLESQVDTVALVSAESTVDNGTTTWDLAFEWYGRNYWDYSAFAHDPGWDYAYFYVYDEEDNLLNATVEGISPDHMIEGGGTWWQSLKSTVRQTAWTVEDAYHTPFVFLTRFDSLPGNATTTRYVIKTRLYNSDEDKWKDYQIWRFLVDPGYTPSLYPTYDQYLDSLEREDKEWFRYIYEATEWLKIGDFIDNFNISFRKKFPISWFFGFFDIWKQKELEYSQQGGTSTAFAVSIAMPESAIILAGVDLKVVDFEMAQEDYGTWFVLFRNLFSYVLWLSAITVIFLKVKRFLMALKEED